MHAIDGVLTEYHVLAALQSITVALMHEVLAISHEAVECEIVGHGIKLLAAIVTLILHKFTVKHMLNLDVLVLHAKLVKELLAIEHEDLAHSIVTIDEEVNILLSDD